MNAQTEAPRRRWWREKALPLRLGLETLVTCAVVLTAFALIFRDDLTGRHLSFGPDGSSAPFVSYWFSDSSDGGHSVASEDKGRPLAWSCSLTNKYRYRYCGFGLMFEPGDTGRGLDLRDFERLKVRLTYQGPGRSLRVVLKNKDQRYLALGAPTIEKRSQASVPIYSGEQTIDLELADLAVAEWWRDSAARPSIELARPEFHNVVAMELLTGVESKPGRYRLVVSEISLEGEAVGIEAWYVGIALAWALLIAGVLLQRRREAAKWKEQLATKWRTTLDTIPHMVWSLDEQGKFHFNRRWEDFTQTMFGSDFSNEWWEVVHRDEIELVVAEWGSCVQSGRDFEVQCRLKHHSGEYRWVVARAVAAKDASGTITGWYGTCTDVHDRVLAQRALVESVTRERRKAQQLKWVSEHDALTGLSNRRAFQKRLDSAVLHAHKTNEQIGLMLINLDHFKHINDAFGHIAGDELLKGVSERLRAAVRHNEMVARLGGDEFAIILENVRSREDFNLVGNAVAAAIQAPMKLRRRLVTPDASIGGAFYPVDGGNAEDIFNAADAALYALKRAGRGGFRMFRCHMLEDIKTAALQLRRAREVIADNTIVALYQPKVRVRGTSLTGFEALLRYRNSLGTLELPETLEEAFKDYELAAKIGEMMHRRVARDIRSWLDDGLEFGHVSLNAAPAEFLRDDYAERLLEVLRQERVSAEYIEVEVTEHVFLDRGTEYVARALTALKEAGAKLSLDDFGTGHSSLSHLRDFPVDFVKIDQSFIRQMVEDEEIAALVAGVINLVCSLGLDVVAEGVETPRQLQLLRSMGCQLAQGYLFGMPMEAARIPAFISGGKRVASAA
ncbi:EAL domain-containing protein [Sphingomonas sp.]|uniref:putative bifunctional diguanylate cyclase/phosphodiesterase n=1 Tax=Sphingomonas sp. TaxID=28214 RepID=UPI00184FD3DA|nr:EAL domain-containing protein [Sphingomonas sp.]MBA3510575.1 EAL domain-containing protein [Sphingomonas sp.]